MIGEVTHQRGADIEAQGGVALGVVFDDSAQVGGETSEAGGRGFSLDGEGFLVIDEAWPYLGENPEVFKARSQANSEQAFHHRLGALLSRDEVEGAIEADAAGEVVIEVDAKSRQVLAARKFGARIAEN